MRDRQTKRKFYPREKFGLLEIEPYEALSTYICFSFENAFVFFSVIKNISVIALTTFMSWSNPKS